MQPDTREDSWGQSPYLTLQFRPQCTRSRASLSSPGTALLWSLSTATQPGQPWSHRDGICCPRHPEGTSAMAKQWLAEDPPLQPRCCPAWHEMPLGPGLTLASQHLPLVARNPGRRGRVWPCNEAGVSPDLSAVSSLLRASPHFRKRTGISDCKACWTPP